MNKTLARVLGPMAIAGLFLTGCGSDGKQSSATQTTTTTAADKSTEKFCADVKAAFGNFQPGFDAIFDKTPNPTLADWAAFLPAPLGEFDAVVARAKTITPPPDMRDAFTTVLDAMEKVSTNFHDSIEAAKAGDEAKFKELEDKNQSTDLPAMQAAFDAGPDCGS